MPYAFSPVCTDEVGALQEAYESLVRRGARVLVISCDPVPSLREWGERIGARMPLLSDFWPHGAAARALDGLDERHGTARRLTVLLGRDGAELWRVQSASGLARRVTDYHHALDLVGERP